MPLSANPSEKLASPNQRIWGSGVVWLTSEADTRKAHVQRLFKRLIARGWAADYIKPIFTHYLDQIRKRQQQQELQGSDVATATTPAETTPTTPKQKPVFLHLQCNPLDPPSSAVQKLFNLHVLKRESTNPYDPPLSEMKKL